MLLPAPRQTKAAHAAPVRPHAQPVDDAVGFLIQPGALVDFTVGGFFPYSEAEYRQRGAIIIAAEIALPFGDILCHQFPAGVAAAPLLVIAVLAHILPGVVVQGHSGV